MSILFIDLSKEINNISKDLVESVISEYKISNINFKRISLRSLEIQPCRECTKDITFEYQENCRCDDDMNKLYPILKEYKSWIFIIPDIDKQTLSYLKNFFDRLEPLFQPVFFINNGSGLSIPDNKINGDISLISTSDNSNMGYAFQIANEISSISLLFGKDYLGTIYRNIDQYFNGSIDINDDKIAIIEELKYFTKNPQSQIA